MAKIKLGVIFGGRSKEHEVSLNSAQSVISALNKEKYEIIPIVITKNGAWLIGKKAGDYLKLFGNLKGNNEISLQRSECLIIKKDKNWINFAEGDIDKKIDLVFPLIHGSFGEDGRLQGMLEMLNLPYLFSNTLASALAMNKAKTQLIVNRVGINILPHRIIQKKTKYNLLKIIKEIGLPIVIKPIDAGSSVGIYIAKNHKELRLAIKKSFFYSDELMLEKYQKGRELTVSIFGNQRIQPLPVIEIIPQISDFYDYQAKYQDGGSKHICPAKIPEKIKKQVQKQAVLAFKIIGCRDLARADFIWDEESNKIYFLEINTVPGMTSTSLAPEAAKAVGMNFDKFLDKIISEGLKRIKK